MTPRITPVSSLPGLCATALVLASLGWQDPPPPPAPPSDPPATVNIPTVKLDFLPPATVNAPAAKRDFLPNLSPEEADPLFAPERLKPAPPTPIPHDPPPHEGAMIPMPTYVVEPPDLIRIEILEGLPGRPITGERLVRPDGTVSLDFYGDMHISGLTEDQIKIKVIDHLRKFIPDESLGLVEERDLGGGQAETMVIAPEDSVMVFVEVTAYNSKIYYVQGDVAAPGRLVSTGRETVLDALTYAAGLLPTADPKDVRLVRPSRGDTPARVYPIDLAAIVERGDSKANLQVFPGDRIVVGRHPQVEASVHLNRTAEPYYTILSQMQSYASTMKALDGALGGESSLTAAQRESIVRAWVNLWMARATRPDEAAADGAALRDDLIRLLLPPAPPQPK